MDDAVAKTCPDFTPKPWGVWATAGFSLAIVAVFIAVQTAAVIAYIVACQVLHPTGSVASVAQGAASNGFLLAWAYWASLPASLGVLLLLVKLRRGWSIREYLALIPVPRRTMLVWLGLTLLFMAIADGLSRLFGLGTASVIWCRKVYQTAYWTPLLWATFVVAAPLYEETFFRGFMFRGIRQSRLGARGAVLITAAVWALMHVQYDAFTVAQIFAGGILLGAARLKTGSLYTTLAMHALWGLVATIEIAVCLHR